MAIETEIEELVDVLLGVATYGSVHRRGLCWCPSGPLPTDAEHCFSCARARLVVERHGITLWGVPDVR